ncbi:MAG: hypothetical protein LQ346_003634 [Caloplaca aetnensis]|nr:MAG: hypothetical protein LQ346_003634 [Caloplaca aetnensis]
MTLPHVSAVGKTRFRSLTSAGLQFNSHVLKPPVSGEQPRSSPTSKEEAAPLRNEECRNSPISQFKWPESGGSFQSFDPIFVRDSCSCRRCVDPSTTQKTFETANIPGNIRAEHVDVQADGRAYITWEPDVPGFENHVSIYEASFGIRNANLESRLEATYNVPGPRIAWRRNTVIQNRLSVQYNEFMAQDRILLSSLDQLYRYGLLFISSVPSHSGSVSSLARRIGPLKSTLYGPTWDVKSVPSAKNVAYTSSDLGFHMDLLYVDNPPGVQILHCLQASTQGGESLFSDSLRAVQSIKHSRPDHYAMLETFPVTYKYRNNNEWYQQTRPHIETETVIVPHEASNHATDVNHESVQLQPSVKAINYSPPFQGPFLVNIGNTPQPPPADRAIPASSKAPELQAAQRSDNREFRKYLDAIRHLKQELEADEAIYEQRLDPGTAVIFDNRRVVHARKAFKDEGGERWLRGAYVDGDAWRSRWRVLREKANKNHGDR